jgi:hypothetical protein
MNATMEPWLSGRSFFRLLCEAQQKGLKQFRWGSGSYLLDFVVPPIDALTAYIGNTATIKTSLSNKQRHAVRAAKGADMAFVFVNAYVSLCLYLR